MVVKINAIIKLVSMAIPARCLFWQFFQWIIYRNIFPTRGLTSQIVNGGGNKFMRINSRLYRGPLLIFSLLPESTPDTAPISILGAGEERVRCSHPEKTRVPARVTCYTRRASNEAFWRFKITDGLLLVGSTYLLNVKVLVGAFN